MKEISVDQTSFLVSSQIFCKNVNWMNHAILWFSKSCFLFYFSPMMLNRKQTPILFQKIFTYKLLYELLGFKKLRSNDSKIFFFWDFLLYFLSKIVYFDTVLQWQKINGVVRKVLGPGYFKKNLDIFCTNSIEFFKLYLVLQIQSVKFKEGLVKNWIF